MPELPEVEAGRRLAEGVALGRRVSAAECADDPTVYDEATPADVADVLVGSRIAAVQRWGKHLWLRPEEGPCVTVHFAMTGAFRTPGDEPLQLMEGPRPDAWPPRFVKLELTFDDGGKLAFVNARRFGRVRLRGEPMEEEPLSGYGFDPLLAMPDLRRFRTLLAGRRGTFAALL